MSFIDLLAAPKRVDTLLRELPPIPVTGWRRPQYYPELRGAVLIAFDCETKETDFDHGPGWGRGEGHIIGVSLAALFPNGETYKGYFPVRHEVGREYNLDPATTFRWLKEQLETPIPKTGANLLYDCGWLATEGIFPAGQLLDLQFAEALIDEEAYVALDVLGYKYLGRGKTVDHCKDWVLRAYPNAKDSNWRGFLWKTPPVLVGPYAEDDALLPLLILPHQWQIMQQEGSLDLFINTECALIPMLVKMRMQGVSVDVGKALALRESMVRETAELYVKLKHLTGVTVEKINSPTQLGKAFDAVGITYPRTSLGKPSFKKEWLKELGEIYDPTGVAKCVVDIREREKLISTFIDSYILDRARHDGTSNSRAIIYCSFHPNKSDDGGAKTGRFSSSDPNLQNIPARTKLGKRVRDIFIPDYGHHCWHKKDESQIEYRIFAHYAVGAGAVEMQQRYINDPATDYHNDTALAVLSMRNIARSSMNDEEYALFRKPIKNVNFGLLYGQTERSLAYKAGWSDDEARTFFGQYHGARPFVRTTMASIENEVQYYGYITTAGGRRLRFNRWEPLRTPKGQPKQNYAYDHAVRLYGSNIKRAFAYRGVNYKFQGSAAEVLKDAMVAGYQAGVYDYIGFPKLTVHDELDWSKISNDNAMNEAYRYMAYLMENTRRKYNVPLKVDSSEGNTWGEAA